VRDLSDLDHGWLEPGCVVLGGVELAVSLFCLAIDYWLAIESIVINCWLQELGFIKSTFGGFTENIIDVDALCQVFEFVIEVLTCLT
jgi:hypothetical protein